jgi:hypothetical protein
LSTLPNPDFVDENDGAALLDEVEAFLARFVAYPSEHARIAHVLWVAHTHRMDAWESTPRIAFLSPEPGSGKSRALEVTELLVPRPIHAINTTPAYLFRKVADEEGAPTLLYDEIDTVFGPRAKDNEDIRGLLNAGHRKGAVAGRCVVRGATVVTEELPAYCAVALAGLDDLPDTLMSRSVIVRMQRRAPHEVIEPFRHRVHSVEGHNLRDSLAFWTRSIPEGAWPEMPEEITDRNADIWEALFAVADEARGDWPERARTAAVTLVTDVTAATASLGVRLLEDIRSVFISKGKDYLTTETLLAALVELEESPWGDLRGKPLDARGLSRRLSKYKVKPKTIRDGALTAKGYDRSDYFDAWSRYCSASVTDVTDVTQSAAGNRDGVTVPPYESSKTTKEQVRDLEDSETSTEGLAPLSPDLTVTSVTPSQLANDSPPQSDEDFERWAAMEEAF